MLFFGCIDSRIDLREVTNASLGELLVDRNPGNIVPAFSSIPSGEASSIEFALMHLNVSDIIVCGHSHCGAMKGLMTPNVGAILPSTAAWLSHAKPALEHLHEHHPELISSPSLALRCLTQDNILLQLEHIKTHPAAANRLAEGKLKIHGWYYEFEKGEIYIYNADKNSFISFEETVEETAQKELEQMIQEEAIRYLNNLTPIINNDHYALLEQFSQMHQVTPIWAYIKAKVRAKAEEKLGELYQTTDGELSPQFAALLKKGALAQVCHTENKYQRIERLFTDIEEYQLKPSLNDEQKKLFSAISKLKIHTLSQFAAQEKQFDFNYCIHLAAHLKNLTHKLMRNTATVLDIEQFRKQSQLFENNITTASTMKAILTTIISISLGLIIGFCIAGVPGSAITASITAALAIGMWCDRKNPTLEVTTTAAKILQK